MAEGLDMCEYNVVNSIPWRATATRVMKLIINGVMRVTWRLTGMDLEGIKVVLEGGVGHCEGWVLWV